MKKLNGFENWIIIEALTLWTEKAESEVKELEKSSKGNLIYAPGYFTMVTDELKEKINSLTLKKHLKDKENV